MYDKDTSTGQVQDPLYYLYDGMGRVTELTSPNAQVSDKFRFDPYGVELPGGKMSPNAYKNLNNPFGYNGEQYDPDAGLSYMRNRYYEPETGRFMTRDLLPGHLAEPFSMNAYAYVSNSPLNFVDPLGLEAKRDYGVLDKVLNTLFPGLRERDEKKFDSIFDLINYLTLGLGDSYNNVMDTEPYTLDNLNANLYLFLGILPQTKVEGQVAKNADSVISKGVGNAADSVIQNLIKEIKEWLADGARLIKNESGDTIIISEDGTRRIRFDINNPSPHNNPHGHVEEFVNGEWVKSGPIYPNDVPHN